MRDRNRRRALGPQLLLRLPSPCHPHRLPGRRHRLPLHRLFMFMFRHRLLIRRRIIVIIRRPLRVLLIAVPIIPREFTRCSFLSITVFLFELSCLSAMIAKSIKEDSFKKRILIINARFLILEKRRIFLSLTKRYKFSRS